MTNTIRDIEIATELPEVPRSMPVYATHLPTLEQRAPAVERLVEALDLGAVKRVDVNECVHYVGTRGGVQLYRPSGGVWAMNNAMQAAYEDERRQWPFALDERTDEHGAVDLVCRPEDALRLGVRARELLEKAGLMGESAYFAGVALDQVSKLDEKGTEIGRFAGEATVKHLYRLNDTPCDGPGAKSYVFVNPGDRGPRPVGLYHCWREIGPAADVRTLPCAEALERAFAQDREILAAAHKKYRVRVDKVELVYYALPPTKFQAYVFPVLHVQGYARAPQDRTLGFGFARFCNAAEPEAYVESGVHALYLRCLR